MIRLKARRFTPLAEVADQLFRQQTRRTLVGLSLMAAQAFFYNAIFFTYALVLTTFYGVPTEQVGWYILSFAAGNVLGPLLLGRLFDTLEQCRDEMESLRTEPGLRDQLGARGKNAVAKNWAVDVHLAQYLQIVESLITTRARTRGAKQDQRSATIRGRTASL